MNYTKVISEDIKTLSRLEQGSKSGKLSSRLNLLRQLKSGYSLKHSSELAGISYRQAQRIIDYYRTGGLSKVVELGYSHDTSNAARLNVAELSELRGRLCQSDIGTLKQAQAYIKQAFGYHYSLGGLSILFARHKIKLKTGRPQSTEQDPGQVQAFKKTSTYT